jgi:hypothetical protein
MAGGGFVPGGYGVAGKTAMFQMTRNRSGDIPDVTNNLAASLGGMMVSSSTEYEFDFAKSNS